jgi:hypothetical protein
MKFIKFNGTKEEQDYLILGFIHWNGKIEISLSAILIIVCLIYLIANR